MTAKLTHLITVRLKRTGGGLLAATSDDLPGLFLTYPTREQIVADLPEVVRALYKADYGEDVTVLLLDSPTDPPILKEERLPLAAIPVEILRELQHAEG